MRSSVSGSGVYNVECQVCGFQYKSNQLKKRWDGLMVCKEDWETRHPLDFYKTRNDVHKLPFVLPAGKEHTYTPVFVNRTTGGTGIIDEGTYVTDNLNNQIVFQVMCKPQDSTSYCSTTSATVSLPATLVTNGTLRVFTKYGEFLGTGTVSGTTGALPDWVANYDTIIIKGTYGI